MNGDLDKKIKVGNAFTHLAICERVSKSRLFIDVLTSKQPIYCKRTKKNMLFSVDIWVNASTEYVNNLSE